MYAKCERSTLLLSMIGIFGGLANLWLISIFKLSEVSLVSPLKYLALIFAIIFGYLIWDEIPTFKTLLGALLSNFFFIYNILEEKCTLKEEVYRVADMSKMPKYWITAKKYLSKKDKVMSALIKKYKSPSEKILTTRKDVFFSLCKSIIGQQISVAAANSVFLRFKKKCNNKINAKVVSDLSFATIKVMWAK